jgi:hypothetical protein
VIAVGKLLLGVKAATKTVRNVKAGAIGLRASIFIMILTLEASR